MKNYTFDVNKMIRWLMPYFLLQPIHYAWLQTLLVTVKNRYADFLAYRDLQLRNATVDSTVIRFTKGLRDEFEDDTIYILHPEDFLDQSFIYLASEGATIEYDYLASEDHSPVDYDYTEAEYSLNWDFIVRIPVALAGSIDAIRAYVKKYAFSGLNYTIETF